MRCIASADPRACARVSGTRTPPLPRWSFESGKCEGCSLRALRSGKPGGGSCPFHTSLAGVGLHRSRGGVSSLASAGGVRKVLWPWVDRRDSQWKNNRPGVEAGAVERKNGRGVTESQTSLEVSLSVCADPSTGPLCVIRCGPRGRHRASPRALRCLA
jgi:hypothetical protein